MLGIGLIVSLKTKRSLDSDNRSMMESIQIIKHNNNKIQGGARIGDVISGIAVFFDACSCTWW